MPNTGGDSSKTLRNRPLFILATRHYPGGLSLQFNHDVGEFIERSAGVARQASLRLFWPHHDFVHRSGTQ
jgi:hypothetical protein